MTQWAGEAEAPEIMSYRTAVITPIVEPFTRDELFAALVRPHRWIDLLLSERQRWTRTVTEGRHAGLLVAIMLAASLLYALPFGLVLGFDRLWHIAALYLGSVAICLPSLHIFAGTWASGSARARASPSECWSAQWRAFSAWALRPSCSSSARPCPDRRP